MTNDDDYIPVELAAKRLRLSIRQATRYAERVRHKRVGRRIFYHKEDIETLAGELNTEDREPAPPRAEMMPAGDVLQTFERQQAQLVAMSHEIGRLTGMLDQQRLLTEDMERVRQRLQAVEAERDRLQRELAAQQQRPWWRRLLDR
jgi:predicted FMN-binding regulatory protein PaiB